MKRGNSDMYEQEPYRWRASKWGGFRSVRRTSLVSGRFMVGAVVSFALLYAVFSALIIQKFTADGGAATGPEEFDIAGATYYVIAPDTNTYSFTATQESNYGARRYETLFDFESAIPASPSTPIVCNIVGDWTGATEDTTVVDINGSTPTASNYVLIRAVDVNGDITRHGGIWDDDCYTLSTAGSTLSINDPYVYLDGLQIEEDLNGSRVVVTVNGSNSKIEYCILRTTSNSNSDKCYFINSSGASPAYIANTVMYNRSTGSTGLCIDADGASAGYNLFVYNCTLYKDGDTALALRASPSTHEPTFKNCIFTGMATTATGDVNDNSDYNATETASFGWTQTTPASNNLTNSTFTFVNAAGSDFHLAAGDTGATDLGTDLSSDTDYAITRDIDYATRAGSWDIGADEK